ncbi:MAG: hypothetical protein AB7U20_07720 [Planctomycetaceae bacterium]
MQIFQSGAGPTIGLHANSANLSKRIPAADRGEAIERLSGGVEILGVSANQLESLAAKLKEYPDTRTDILAPVRERIEQGHYLTREAAQRTAANLRGT